MRRIVKQELVQAFEEKRQPNCPYCQQPLEVEQVQREYIRWTWSNEEQRFLKTADVDADEAQCYACGEEDKGFLADTSATPELCEKLGLIV